jgi:hypothetical protein
MDLADRLDDLAAVVTAEARRVAAQAIVLRTIHADPHLIARCDAAQADLFGVARLLRDHSGSVRTGARHRPRWVILRGLRR